MQDREIKNAIITSTKLGKEDHGIMSCMIMLDYGGSGQGFGGYIFDDYNEETNSRHGTAFGMEFIMQILKVLEKENWEDLIGTHCRVDGEWGKIYRVGHFMKDQWFDPQELADKMCGAQE
ncbi:MAG: hypothetical protein GY737_00105 [Desulfobacteraceae bacterium]|nr:hypothetical protein [Desulfobacteraceae bacterium]